MILDFLYKKILRKVPNPAILFSGRFRVLYINDKFFSSNISIASYYLSYTRYKVKDLFFFDDVEYSKIERFVKSVKDKEFNVVYLNYHDSAYCVKLYRYSRRRFVLEFINKAQIEYQYELVTGLDGFFKNAVAQQELTNELLSRNDEILRMISLYNKISARFLECTNVNDLYRTLDDAMMRVVAPDYFQIIYGSEKRGFKTVYQHHLHVPESEILVYTDSSFVSSVSRGKKPVIFRNIEIEMPESDKKLFPEITDKQSAVLIPIFEANEVRGVLIAGFNKNFVLDNFPLNMMMGIANLASITLDKLWYIKEQRDLQSAMDRHERLIAMGRIIAGVAHEVNNPLSIMQFDLDELKALCEEYGAYPKVETVVSSIQEEIERMNGIVRQLKDYSKSNDDSITDAEMLEVDELFKTYPLKILLKNIQKKVLVELELNCDEICIQIPRNRIIQVLMNIITNAEEAIVDKESGKIVVSTQLTPDESSVAIRIHDNGSAIEKSDISRIFDPFFTTKKGEGTGLGLSISYSIVKRYNGEIVVESEKEAGTTFSVIFPAAKKQF